LPFYLTKPQWPQKKNVYKFSNGKQKLLSATVEKQYLLKADFMPVTFHESFTTALLHDYVKIECANIIDSPVEIINSESYTVDWGDDETEQETAQGRSVLTVSTFGFRNDNFD
jgi:hypothetical protein